MSLSKEEKWWRNTFVNKKLIVEFLCSFVSQGSVFFNINYSGYIVLCFYSGKFDRTKFKFLEMLVGLCCIYGKKHGNPCT